MNRLTKDAGHELLGEGNRTLKGASVIALVAVNMIAIVLLSLAVVMPL